MSALTFSFAAFAVIFAQVIPDPETIGPFLEALTAAIASGNWPTVAVLALVAGVWALRKYGVKKLPFFQSEIGGTALVALTAFTGAVAAAAFAGGPIVWAVVLLGAAKAAATAAGGWQLVQAAVRWLLPKALGSTVARIPGVEKLVLFVLERVVKSKAPELVATQRSAIRTAPTPAPEPVPVRHVAEEDLPADDRAEVKRLRDQP